jgi:hypothetical protein
MPTSRAATRRIWVSRISSDKSVCQQFVYGCLTDGLVAHLSGGFPIAVLLHEGLVRGIISYAEVAAL